MSLDIESDALKRDKDGVVVVDKEFIVKVSVNKDDVWALEQSRFEVAFYVDHQFFAEEEQGYLPFKWKFNPKNLEKGVHVLTLNVVGFDGQIGAAILQFRVI